ncbi:MAG: hypothetical protein ACKPKO_62765, partial [Candidatus Fonsibacter sp.]
MLLLAGCVLRLRLNLQSKISRKSLKRTGLLLKHSKGHWLDHSRKEYFDVFSTCQERFLTGLRMFLKLHEGGADRYQKSRTESQERTFRWRCPHRVPSGPAKQMKMK